MLLANFTSRLGTVSKQRDEPAYSDEKAVYDNASVHFAGTAVCLRTAMNFRATLTARDRRLSFVALV